MRAILYLRLSQSDDASTSIQRQETDLRLRAEREGWEVVDVLVDDGVSGGKSRANAEVALDYLRTGRAEVLAVWKFDRWSRQGLGALADLIRVLDDRPKALFVADRDGLSSAQPAWRIIASVLAEVARMERENTRTRVLSSLAALRTSGRYAGGQRPYGYVSAPNPDGPGRILVVDPFEAQVVREAADRILSGETPYSVAHDLNRRGIPSKSGKRWSATVLRELLQRDAIVGRVTHRGNLVRGDDGLPLTVWEPVLDLALWHRLRVHLGAISDARRERKAPRQGRPTSRLLAGIVKCASCGSSLYVRSSGRGIFSYACIAKADGRVCVGVAVNAERIEEFVEERFLAKVGPLRRFLRVKDEVADAHTFAEIERAIAQTTEALAEDDADLPALLARLASLKAQRAEQRERNAAPEIRLVDTGETYAEAWERMDTLDRRDLLAANVAILTVSKGKRGHHGLDASRVTLVAQPAQPSDADGKARIIPA